MPRPCSLPPMCRSLSAVFAAMLAMLAALGATANADVIGGTAAPAAPQAGGSQFGVRSGTPGRPVIHEFYVPASVVSGGPPHIALRIDERGVGTVRARVVFLPVRDAGSLLRVDLGWVHTGRRIVLRWPVSARLRPGSYIVRLHAYDHQGATLLRRGRRAGRAVLVVRPAPAPPPVPTPLPVAPVPISPVRPGGISPVAGPHSFGGPDARFGAQRNGHIHQGQDVMAAEGTPVVAPFGGTVTSTAYQAGGAGYYAVEQGADGRGYFFAHCQAASLVVGAGQAVAAGQRLCAVGHTGDASGPHLHFEIWPGGWRVAGAAPIDPLPDLLSWDHAG